MTDSPKQVWVIPSDPADMAPLPVLIDGVRFSYYDRRRKTFGAFDLSFDQAYDSFEECRAAMIDARIEALDQAREQARNLANSIEHIRTIPNVPFPNVLREVPEAEQVEQGEQGQEKAQAEEVKPKPATLKRPTRRN